MPPKRSSPPSEPRSRPAGGWAGHRPNPLRPTEQDRRLARSGPAGYAYVRSRGRWRPAAHLALINRVVVSVAHSIQRGEERRVMVFMPPRHGKSELISRHTPAWFLGRWPDRRVILASFGANLAFRFGRQARDDLAETGPLLFGAGVDPAVAARDRWAMLAQGDPDSPESYLEGGGMLAAGVGGAITGEGADLFIIDDPVKNQEEAASEVIQERNLDWWQSTASTRLMPGGAVIVLQTRWHELDLAGQLLALGAAGEGDEWEVLCLPALAEPDHELQPNGDELGRAPGAALWPAQFDEQALAAQARRSGVFWFSALYQQRPLPAGGLVFLRENFRYFTEAHDPLLGMTVYTLHRDAGLADVRVSADHTADLMVVDPALSEKETADFTAIGRFAVTHESDLLLREIVRARFEEPALVDLIWNTWLAWGKPMVKVEKAAHGTALIAQLRRRGMPVGELVADTDKVTRARGAAPVYEAHKVYHQTGAGWLDAYEGELLRFPSGKNDDQVDVFSYAALSLAAVAPARAKRPDDEQRKPITAGVRTAEM